MYRKRAQLLLEYVILTSVIIAVIVVFSGKFFDQVAGKPNTSGSQGGTFYRHFQNMNERMEGVKAP